MPSTSSSKAAKAFEPDQLLADTFRHMIAVCTYLSADGILDEETLTGTVLGALASAYPLILKEAGSPRSQTEFFWSRYNKARARDKHSEAANGADFTLVLLGDNGLAHLAVFQAKRSAVSFSNGVWTLDIRHESTNIHGNKCAQMVALAKLADLLLAQNNTPIMLDPNDELGHIGWIHYLAYGDGSPLCLPLSKMSHLLPHELSLVGSSNDFEFDPATSRTFFDVLEAGLHRKTTEWLTVRTKAVFELLPAWINVMPVIFASTRKGWTHVPRNRLPQHLNAKPAPSARLAKSKPAPSGSRTK